jgi:hypothetical protein
MRRLPAELRRQAAYDATEDKISKNTSLSESWTYVRVLSSRLEYDRQFTTNGSNAEVKS